MVLKINTGSAFMLFLFLFNIAVVELIFPAAFFFLRERGLDAVAIFTSPWIGVAGQLIGLILPLVIWLALKKDSIHHHLPNMRLGWINIILIVGFSIFIQPTMMLLAGIASLIFPNPVAELLHVTVAHPLWVMIIVLAVTPAICEELVFRGYIQSQYMSHSLKKAAFINGLFFAIIHASPHQFAYAFVMGIIFFLFVYLSRSIRAGILSHFIINASQVALSRLGQPTADIYDALNGWAQTATVYYDTPSDTNITWPVFTNNQVLISVLQTAIIAIIFAPAVWILFRAFLSHNRQRITRHDMRLALHNAEFEDTKDTSADDNPGEVSSFADPFLIAVILLFFVYVMALSF